jgi:hypothetical protein
MGFYVKTSNSGWSSINTKKVYVKTTTGNSPWSTVKKLYVKFSNTVSPYWKLITGNAGPDAHYSPTIATSSTAYGSSPDPKLTGYNYHWTYNTSLTLKYNFQNGTSPTTLNNIFSSPQTFTPGNPTLAAEPNSITYTPVWPTDYISNPTYFSFSMIAQDAKGTTSLQSGTVSISIPAPYWNSFPGWSGTYSPGYTMVWTAGKAYINGSSSGVGYQTTIYKSNDGGATKTYLYGTSTTPDFQYVDNKTYSFTLTDSDKGYTFYASTYAIAATSSGPLPGAASSSTISYNQKIVGAPGSFSITSFTKGAIVNNSRTLSATFSTSQDATYYQYFIEYSTDNVSWGVAASYSQYVQIYPPSTSFTYTTNNPYHYYRLTMRAGNESGLYTVSTNTLNATGTPPGAPTINSIDRATNYLTINFTPPSSVGSGSAISSYNIYYRVTGTTPYSFANSTYYPSNKITLTGLTGGTSYDIMIQAINDDGIAGDDSNLVTQSTIVMPDNLTNVAAKSFASGQITFSYTTGNNTTGVYYYVTSGPNGGPRDYVDNQYGTITIGSNQSGTYTVSSLYWTNGVNNYDITLYPQNGDFTGTGYGNGTTITNQQDIGQDAPQSSNPTITYITSSGFIANYTLFNTSSVLIDLKTGGSSVSGYPLTVNQTSTSSGTGYTYSPSGLVDGSTYTIYVTPKYTTSPYSVSGTQVSSSAQQILGNPQAFDITSTSKAYPVAGTPGHRSVVVNWSKSTDATRYEVHLETSDDGLSWSDTDGQTYSQSPYIQEPTRTATINAVAHTYYRATVRASNTIQTSNLSTSNPTYYSYSSSVNVAGTAPGDPTIGTITPQQITATVAYTATSSKGSNNLAGVQWSLDNSSWSATTTSNPISITGLTGGTNYTVYLRSVNNDGLTSGGVNKNFSTASIGSIASYTVKYMSDGFFTIFFTTSGNVDSVTSYADRYYPSTTQTSPSASWTPSPLGTASPAVAGRNYATIAVSGFTDYNNNSYRWTGYLTPSQSGISGTKTSISLAPTGSTDIPTITLGTPTTGDGTLSSTVSYGGSANAYVLDVKTGGVNGTSLTGYPKTYQTGDVSLSGLTNGTAYTIIATPYYYYYHDTNETASSLATSIRYPGTTVNTTATPNKVLGAFTINNVTDNSPTPTTPTTPTVTIGTGTYRNDVFIDWVSSKPSDTAGYTQYFYGTSIGATSSTFTVTSPNSSSSKSGPGTYQTDGTITGGTYEDFWPIVRSGTFYEYIVANGTKLAQVSWGASTNANSYIVNYTISGASSGNGTVNSPAQSGTTFTLDMTANGGTFTLNSVTAYLSTDGTGTGKTGTLPTTKAATPAAKTSTSGTGGGSYTYYVAPTPPPAPSFGGARGAGGSSSPYTTTTIGYMTVSSSGAETISWTLYRSASGTAGGTASGYGTSYSVYSSGTYSGSSFTMMMPTQGYYYMSAYASTAAGGSSSTTTNYGGGTGTANWHWGMGSAPAPGSISNTITATGNPGTYTFTWGAVSGAQNYQVTYGTNTTAPSPNPPASVVGNLGTGSVNTGTTTSYLYSVNTAYYSGFAVKVWDPILNLGGTSSVVSTYK